MGKLYYTDVLIIAYMAHEFEVVVEKEVKNSGFFRVNHRRDMSANKADFKWDAVCRFDISITPSGKWDRRTSPHKPPFYIHEDSLPIFEPQVGDIGKIDGEDEVVYYQNFQGEKGWYDGFVAWGTKYYDDAAKIIQRDGKQFFHPQEE